MADLPTQLRLTVGEQHPVELPGAGMSGYQWREEISGASGIITVTWQRGFPPGTPMPAVGVSAPETAVITAHQPGDVTLLLQLLRPWEKGVAPQQEHRLPVHVEAASPPPDSPGRS